ncbi:MAG: serine/threonine protein phosphatase [Methanimicrococcus sp.]|nr:serine/threonine protein phosphatase [Methanimicrococcus sp.]
MSDKKQKDRLSLNLAHVTPLLKKDDAVVYMNEKKTLIATDIHGNADSLDFILEFADKKKVDSWIFLGDYVDKGPDSVGVLNRLFELKRKNPKKVILLRGNHETKDVNSFYEFQNTVHEEPDLYAATNTAFENMPVAVVLNKNIFCVHGGISGKKTESVEEITKKESFCYLWNDPSDEEGLTPSPRGGEARRFGPDVTKKFLKNNNLQIILRGHSTLENGLKFWFDHTLISLYSSLPYSDPYLKAAVAIAEKNHLEFFFYKKDKKDNFVWEEMSISLTLPTDDKK